MPRFRAPRALYMAGCNRTTGDFWKPRCSAFDRCEREKPIQRRAAGFCARNGKLLDSDAEGHRGAKGFTALRIHPLQASPVSKLMEESPMMLVVFAALTAAAAIWVIAAPWSPQSPTMDEFSQLIVLGFIP
jgi:hypothetical protein